MEFCDLSSIGVLEIASHHIPKNSCLCTTHAPLVVVAPPITQTPFLVISPLTKWSYILRCILQLYVFPLLWILFSFYLPGALPQPSALQVTFTSCFVSPSSTPLHRILTHCLTLIVSVFLEHPVLTWLSVPITILLTCVPQQMCTF